MLLLDVNVLVQAHREDADRHEEVQAWIGGVLATAAGFAVSDLVLSGVLRVITHPKVFKEPTPTALACEYVEDLRSRPNVHVLDPGKGNWQLFMDLCRSAEARGNRIPDAYHAALAIEYGCEWITMDRGFARFPGLKWRHPLD